MICAWDSFLALIPHWMRQDVNRLGRDKVLEVRLRIGSPPELILPSESKYLSQNASAEDLSFCINISSKYSPWASSTLRQGFITAQGGHRVGVCGNYISQEQGVGINDPGMINLRIARNLTGISKDLYKEEGSLLIIGKPGNGKTTLLRDLIIKRSNAGLGSVSVVDERQELFPRWDSKYCFHPGPHTDVLSGCKKSTGIILMLKNMTPSVIAVDEITDEDDCDAMINAGWCGVPLYATAHAASTEDLYARPIYRPIIETGLFSKVVVMHQDKSWHLERIKR